MLIDPVNLQSIAYPIGWLVVALFITGIIANTKTSINPDKLIGVAWVFFGVFWALMTPFFLLVHLSAVEAILTAIAAPICIYLGTIIYRGDSRESLYTLSYAVGIMGLIYLPFETIGVLHDSLIEIVTRHTELTMQLMGFSPEVTHTEDGVRSRFQFQQPDGMIYRTRIVLACTGIGAMAIFGGLIAATKAAPKRKLTAMAAMIVIIWILNIFRNIFITIAYAYQLFQFDSIITPIMWLFGLTTTELVSFYVADRIFSQLFAVIALVLLFIGLIRIIPELRTIVEDFLSLLTGSEFELDRAIF